MITGSLNCANLTVPTPTLSILTRGNKLFDLSNQLGNVLATISDKSCSIQKIVQQ